MFGLTPIPYTKSNNKAKFCYT